MALGEGLVLLLCSILTLQLVCQLQTIPPSNEASYVFWQINW